MYIHTYIDVYRDGGVRRCTGGLRRDIFVLHSGCVSCVGMKLLCNVRACHCGHVWSLNPKPPNPKPCVDGDSLGGTLPPSGGRFRI